MLSYIARRILLMIPTLIGMTLLLFSIVRFAPGVANPGGLDTFGGMQSAQAREEQIRAVKRRLRMIDDQGRPIPFYMQYALWLKDTFTGNLGESLQYHKPVSEVIAERLPITITLSLLSTVIVYIISLPGGMIAAAKRGRSFDVLWSVVTLALYSLPVIWVGGMLIGFFANPQYFGWFPSAGLQSTDTSAFTFGGMLRDYLWHLALPLVCFVYASFAFNSKMMRASMLENLYLDYARTARAKGLPAHTVVLRHVFRNSLLPLITMAAGILPGLLGGSVIIETMFSIKGMGQLAFQATLARDLPVIQALGFVGAVLTLISYLITDLCYAFADPRVSYD
jgi:ABC-type dipeptide/oligopeptide/nickel transport system permease component